MIIVTGASGNVGRYVVEELAAAGHAVRALSRSPSTQRGRAGVEWVNADFDNPERLREVFKGASRVVLISPAHRDMQAHQLAVLAAAKDAGVKRIAKLSGLGAGPEAGIRLPRIHYAIEQAIVDSGIPYSFIRPNLFMQVLLGSTGSIAAEGAIYAPAGDGRISFTDARDVARALAREVVNDSGAGVICEITGPDALSYADVAAMISLRLHREVRHVDVTPEQARAAMLDAGMDEWLVEAFVELFAIYRAGYGAAVLSGALEAATGAPARSLAAFLDEHTPLMRACA